MLLEKINSPKDLKNFTLPQLHELCTEVRQRIIEIVSQTGGHLASSLGTVELITALHYCFDMPKDKIIFDVGHQAYAHKILTGRNKEFQTLRQYKGLSGFPSKDESDYDIFTTGHSSTAISLALGLACARDYSLSCGNGDPFKVAAVIGDGSLSGGLCFEGLNNAGHFKKDMLVVLNTNELSISPNVGAISTYLNKIISMPVYNRFMSSLEEFVKSRMPKGSRLIDIANKFEKELKGLFIPGMLFEELGFRYFGPFNGHDLDLLIKTLKNVINIKGPRLVHVVTKKGKGYPPAETEPVKFHGISPFTIENGDALSKKETGTQKTYTQVFSERLTELARVDKKIVAITAAMPEGTGLDGFRDKYPERFFDVGIAEEHAVCFAAGLAREGLKPVVAIYSTFLQRAYDQIMEEAALQNLPVVFAVDRAGIVGEDGVTHQGIFDIIFLRSVPNLVVMAPKDGFEFEAMLEFAFNSKCPVAIRYPRAVIPSNPSILKAPIELGKAELLKEGGDFTIIALGSMVIPAQEAIELLAKEGLKGALINARFAKPLDNELIQKVCAKSKFIFTVEEGVEDEGFGSAVREALNRQVFSFGLPSAFIAHGKRSLMLEKFGLTAKGIADKIRSIYA